MGTQETAFVQNQKGMLRVAPELVLLISTLPLVSDNQLMWGKPFLSVIYVADCRNWAPLEYLDCSLAFKKIFPKFSSQITQPLSLVCMNSQAEVEQKDTRYNVPVMPSNVHRIQSIIELLTSD